MPHSVKCSPRRVLVVDDNVDLADTLAAVLGICGHHVEKAYDGLEAVEKAQAARPEVVICDLGLPKLTGFGVAQRLRSDEQLRDVLLIALSAYDAEKEALDAGFDHFVAKPADLRALASLLAAPAREAAGERADGSPAPKGVHAEPTPLRPAFGDGV